MIKWGKMIPEKESVVCHEPQTNEIVWHEKRDP